MNACASGEWSRTRQHSPQLCSNEREGDCLIFGHALFVHGPLYVRAEDELTIDYE